MTRPTYVTIRCSVAALGAALLLSGCGADAAKLNTANGTAAPSTTTTTTTEVPAPEPTAEIMSAAAFQLATVDNTFGGDPAAFSTFLVMSSTDPQAGSGGGSPDAPTRPLTAGERSAVESRLSTLGEVQWIDDGTDRIAAEQLPGGSHSAIIGLGEPMINGDTALARVSLWCGNLCGTWLTYTLAPDAEGHWAVTGYHGPRAIS